jgi:hypothetical protein
LFNEYNSESIEITNEAVGSGSKMYIKLNDIQTNGFLYCAKAKLTLDYMKNKLTAYKDYLG